MKARCVAITAVMLFFMAVGNCQQETSGDIWRWLPLAGGDVGKDSQIVKNTQYISIKIEAAHVSYKSGFLENIKQIVVSSNVSFDLPSQKVQALTVNRTWQKSNKADDNVPTNDLLAVLSPALPNNINIKMSFAGIGQDKFRSIFDLLAGNDVKTALNLSPASIAQAGLITSIAQKFLATPYTSSNPKDVLSMSQGFVIHSDKNTDRDDSLRQGYLVVISASENKSANLNRVLQMGNDGLRFDTVYHILQFKAPDNSWQEFTGNSYVVLSVTADSVRGKDENSAWFKKYSDATSATDGLVTGDTLANVKKQALKLWHEGNILLDADANYINSEKQSIYDSSLNDIQERLKKNGASAIEADLTSTVPGVPANLPQVAKEYDMQVQNAKVSASVVLHVRDPRGQAVSGVQVAVKNTITGTTQTAVTDQAGDAMIQSLHQATYEIDVVKQGFGVTTVKNVAVQPREVENLSVTVN